MTKSYKKGFVYTVKDASAAEKVASLNPAWYYTWNSKPISGVDRPFVPMVWGETTAMRGYVMNALQGKPEDCLLGFNEPDRDDQSNLTVGRAVDLWQYLVNTGCRLGSPATASNALKEDSWFAQFMAQSPKVDFIAIHWYSAPNPGNLLSLVDGLHAKYGLPIWITEFAVADWKIPNKYTPEQVAEFMKEVIPELEARPHVERYSWKTRTLADVNMGSSSLFNDDGSLTNLGKLYAFL